MLFGSINCQLFCGQTVNLYHRKVDSLYSQKAYRDSGYNAHMHMFGTHAHVWLSLCGGTGVGV